MAITRALIVSVPVADQDRAKDFYVNTLGFDLTADEMFGENSRWVQVTPKGAATSLTLITHFPTMPPGSLKGLVLETDDLDGDVERLLGLGVDIPAGIEEQPWARFAQFADADGNGIVLQARSAWNA